MNRKIMVIGLDGGTWKLLNKWIDDNKLPTFRKIVHSGSKAILKSTIPSFTAPALASLFTGMNPGNHGVLSFVKSDKSVVTLSDIEYPKIWNILDRNGFCSCIVNIRLTFPPEKINGIMISGSVPSEKSEYVYPEYLYEKIKDFKNDINEKIIFDLRVKKRNKEARNKLKILLIEQMKRRYNIFKNLNKEGEYDLSILWIDETDIIQHWLWEYKEIIMELYAEIDNILKDIISSFPKKDLFIVSDHGFGASVEKFFYVNTWLQMEGKLKKKPWPPLHYFINFLQYFGYCYSKPMKLWKMLAQIKRVSKKLKLGNPRVRAKSFIDRIDNFPGIDKNNSQAYLSTTYGINLNDFGDYDRVRYEIISKLRNLKDENGEYVIREIWNREEVYKGKYIEEIPDIIFLASDKYLPFPSLSRNIFRDIKKRKTWWKSGSHPSKIDGIFMAYGPNIKRNIDLGHAKIEDITPTILHLLGVDIPVKIDGKLLINIFRENSYPANNKPSYKEYNLFPKRKIDLNNKDKEIILERLKKLGYLE